MAPSQAHRTHTAALLARLVSELEAPPCGRGLRLPSPTGLCYGASPPQSSALRGLAGIEGPPLTGVVAMSEATRRGMEQSEADDLAGAMRVLFDLCLKELEAGPEDPMLLESLYACVSTTLPLDRLVGEDHAHGLFGDESEDEVLAGEEEDGPSRLASPFGLGPGAAPVA